MRHTELRRRLEQHLGDAYAASWARDQVLATLGGRTVEQALAAGMDAKDVWRGVWAALGLPPAAR